MLLTVSRYVLVMLLPIAIAAQSLYAQWTPLVTSAPALAQESLSNSSYVIDKDGRLFVWGENAAGQLGLGTSIRQSLPQQVPLPSGRSRWVRVAAGRTHAIAIADSDGLYSWGSNGHAELGIGTTVASLVPIRVANPPGVRSWRSVSVGEDHSAAMDDAGELYTWGAGDRGQLGTGSFTQSASPVRVVPPVGVRYWTAAAAGAGFTVAIGDNGELYAWGLDSSHSWLPSASARPVRIANGFRGYGPLPTIAATAGSFVAITKTGAISGYGKQSVGWQMNAFTVAIGGDHTLALHIYGPDRSLGAAYGEALGGNRFGQIGDGTTHYASAEGLKFPAGVSSWTAIAAGLNHSLSIGDDGYLYVWGDNSHGQLGLPNIPSDSTPHRLMQVCENRKLKVRLSIPPELPEIPFTISAIVTDSAGQSVESPEAHLIVTPTLWMESAQDQAGAPSHLVGGDSSTTVWSVGGDSVNGFSTSASISVYVTAKGSAPAFATAQIILRVKRGPRPIIGHVRDAATSKPIEGATVYTHSERDTTLADGSFLVGDPGDTTTVIATKQNFKSYIVATARIPYLPDTLRVEILLDSASPVGTFRPILPMRGFERIYFPDSVVGFAIRTDSVFRSNDAGRSWRVLTRLLQPLTSLVFANPDEGWVVGKQGLIAHTTDGGGNWRYENRFEEGPDLYSVAYANGQVWAVGDDGTIVTRPVGDTWGIDSITATRNLRCVHMLDIYRGVAVGEAGFVFTHVVDRWLREPIGATSTLTACFMPSQTCAFFGDSLGTLYSIDPYDLYSLAKTYKVGLAGPITSIFFINPAVGWAVGGNGSSVVTYDSGHTWAPVPELIAPQTSVDFWSITGRSSSIDRISEMEGRSISTSAIIRGRVIDPSGARGVSGAKLTLHGADGKDRVTFSNQKGNYVFTDVPGSSSPTPIDLYFWDTTGVWRAAGNVSATAGAIETLNFRHPFATVRQTASSQSLRVGATYVSGAIDVAVSMDSPGPLTVLVYDVLGREVHRSDYNAGVDQQTIRIPAASLPAGVYVIQARTGTSVAYIKLSIPQ
jgi:alpha-tubulin suppressor-like RCC1 family protein